MWLPSGEMAGLRSHSGCCRGPSAAAGVAASVAAPQVASIRASTVDRMVIGRAYQNRCAILRWRGGPSARVHGRPPHLMPPLLCLQHAELVFIHGGGGRRRRR